MTDLNSAPFSAPDSFWKPIIAAGVRHVLGGVGMYLVGIGALPQNQEVNFETIGVGFVMFAIAVGWSWWQKVGQAKLRALIKSAAAGAGDAAKTAGIILLAVAFGLSPAFSGRAIAAAALTPQGVAQAIQKASVPDLQYAMKLATAANTVQSKVRLQCYQAILGAVSPPGASDLGAEPSPHLVTSVEQLAELIDALQPTSPVFVNCAGAAQLANLSVLGFVNAVVTGTVGVAAIAPKIP
jgi:hypothetical protein